MTLREMMLTEFRLFGFVSEHQAVALMKFLGDSGQRPGFTARGRGPDSGPIATPENMALFVLAVLAGGPQTEAATVVDKIAALPSRIRMPFGEGVAAILRMAPEEIPSATVVAYERIAGAGMVSFGSEQLWFGAEPLEPDARVAVVAAMGCPALRRLADLIR